MSPPNFHQNVLKFRLIISIGKYKIYFFSFSNNFPKQVYQNDTFHFQLIFPRTKLINLEACPGYISIKLARIRTRLADGRCSILSSIKGTRYRIYEFIGVIFYDATKPDSPTRRVTFQFAFAAVPFLLNIPVHRPRYLFLYA